MKVDGCSDVVNITPNVAQPSQHLRHHQCHDAITGPLGDCGENRLGDTSSASGVQTMDTYSKIDMHLVISF